MSTDEELDMLHTIPQIAALRNIPKRTLFYAAQQGYLRTTRIAGIQFVTLRDVDKWEASAERRKPRKK